jgi:hypothetical protein
MQPEGLASAGFAFILLASVARYLIQGSRLRHKLCGSALIPMALRINPRSVVLCPTFPNYDAVFYIFLISGFSLTFICAFFRSIRLC